jgi:hypothetical protein
MSKTFLTFSDLARQEHHEDIWVLNTSQGDRRGNVFFPVPNQTGTREDTVTVFTTAAPTNLTDQVTRKQLLDSSSFRKAVNHNLLALITSEHAAKMLEDPMMREEYQRVKQLSVGSATSEAQFGVGKETSPVEAVVLDADIGNPVQQFADLMDTMDDRAALMSLRNMGVLKIEEYRHILKRARELRYEVTGKHAAEEIKKIKDGQKSKQDLEDEA